MFDMVKKEGSIKAANPGVSWDWIVGLLVGVLAPIVPILTKGIRDELVKFLTELYGRAESTVNPWDDFIVEILLRILGAPVPGR